MNILVGLAAGASQAGIFGAIQPLLNDLQQNSYWAQPNLNLPADALTQGLMRQLLSDNRYDREMREQGFSPTQQKIMIGLYKQLLNAHEMIDLHRRTEGGLPNFYERMATIGVEQDTADDLLKVYKPIPSVQDIITFAVREIYKPEIAEANKQFEGYEEVYNNARIDLQSIGMDEEYFRKAWGAHWTLPSTLQGFEMFHREIIDKQGLDNLLIALDIMPGWRDKLTAMSHNLLTRVDVRRMHKLGVIDDEETFDAYANMGYNVNVKGHEHASHSEAYACPNCVANSDAGRMLRFTVEYNSDPPEEEKTEEERRADKEKDLTKADILKGYRNKYFTAPEAINQLYIVGFSLEEAQYLIDVEDFIKQDDLFNLIIDIAHDSFIRGTLGKNDVLALLGSANMPGALMDELLTLWEIERIPRLKQPTKAELFGWLKLGLIDEMRLRLELSNQGYKDEYIQFYLDAFYAKVGE